MRPKNLDAVLLVGAQLANVAFNLHQGRELSAHEREQLGKLYERWDAATRALREELREPVALPFSSLSEAVRELGFLFHQASSNVTQHERRLRTTAPRLHRRLRTTRAALNKLLREHYGRER